MDKHEHGLRLKAAMARKRFDRRAIADLTNVKPRTVTNWTSGATMPPAHALEVLATVLGDYAADEGDEVEAAVRRSPLIRWRQQDVLATYERHLHEQQSLEEVRDA